MYPEDLRLTHKEDMLRFLPAIGEVDGWVLAHSATEYYIYGIPPLPKNLCVIPPKGISRIKPLVEAISDEHGYTAVRIFLETAAISGFAKRYINLDMDLTNNYIGSPLRTVEKYGVKFEQPGSYFGRLASLRPENFEARNLVRILYLIQEFEDAFTNEECEETFTWISGVKRLKGIPSIIVEKDGVKRPWVITLAAAAEAFYYAWKSKEFPYGKIPLQSLIQYDKNDPSTKPIRDQKPLTPEEIRKQIEILFFPR